MRSACSLQLVAAEGPEKVAEPELPRSNKSLDLSVLRPVGRHGDREGSSKLEEP
jgi:hypothetical protein